MMRSERVLVKVHGLPGWRGDSLRFRVNSGDAETHAHGLKSTFRHVEQTLIAASDDLPTHSYDRNDLRLLVDLPNSFIVSEVVPGAEPFNIAPAFLAALAVVVAVGAVLKLLL